jgi:hypothetical protein
MHARRPSSACVRGALVATATVVVALSACAVALGVKGAPPGTARGLAQTYFSNALTRAEIVSVVGRVVHDYRIDEGRVTAIRPGAIDLLERDGTRQTIAVGPQTQVLGGGRIAAIRANLRGVRVVTLRDNNAAATFVRPSAAARSLGRSLFGPSLVRAEVVTYAAKTAHDFRMDEGRVVAVRVGSVTLLERDGTRQVVAISPAAIVTENGQTVDASAIVPGLAALTVREGNDAASQVFLAPSLLGIGR